MGRLVTGPDYLKAEQLRRVLMEDVRHGCSTTSTCVIGPTSPLTAWQSGEWTVRGRRQARERAGGVMASSPIRTTSTGLPAISVPCGFDRDGLPIGLQIAGRAFDEATVLRVAHAYERAHEWKDAVPPL